MKLRLKIWRQKNRNDKGSFVSYSMDDVNPEMSMLECLDVLNETLIERGEEPVTFEHDCREGICGSCGFMINGIPHGPQRATTVCQLTMRHFKDGEELVIEPWRAGAFPMIKDLMVDRRALDRIIESGGYISVSTGNAPDGNDILIGKDTSDRAMDAAACIGCGACVAACPNASAALFTGAKITHLGVLPQGKIEAERRALGMVGQMNTEDFGSCTNIGECTAACPKEIPLEVIARMNQDYWRASAKRRDDSVKPVTPVTRWNAK
ncbi:succinate dehydrogenase/fumarate reductase iron-sulfur subunit [Silvibacterium acidisoli]|uniref:succinate dehydrogenase/fumarate reductase iron-sulfur subunit n=1 Tax=Acidobacteriaceae bacterium ZG23-2 TaxID=2883246 RepID=UPI00406C5F54